MSNLRRELALGFEIAELIPPLSQLRMDVFHEFPYLYEGSLEYEQNYLQIYTQNPLSLVYAVFDGDRMVGATTGMPLTAESKEIQQPFIDRNANLREIFYFAESILLPGYRGQGIGHQFFDIREKHALEHGFRVTTFCSVVRPADHPLRPEAYRPNNDFWKKRGYIEQDYCCQMSWLDRNETTETEKELIFWKREWR